MVELEPGHCYLNSQDMISFMITTGSLNSQDMISQVNIYLMDIVWIHVFFYKKPVYNELEAGAP